jgi:hypothetical protein
MGALDRSLCARAHVTALKTHGVAGEAMAARATWALRMMRHALDHAPWA